MNDFETLEVLAIIKRQILSSYDTHYAKKLNLWIGTAVSHFGAEPLLELTLIR